MIKLKKAWRNYNKKPERRNTKQKRKDTGGNMRRFSTLPEEKGSTRVMADNQNCCPFNGDPRSNGTSQEHGTRTVRENDFKSRILYPTLKHDRHFQ